MKEGFEMERSIREFIGITIIIVILFFAMSGISSLGKKEIDPETIGKFKIYSKDINTDKEIIVEEFGFYKDVDTIEKRLKIIASKLSDSEFKMLPIELIGIEEIDGKIIATFNLKENEENLNESDWTKYSEPSWSKNFFQGSAGGSWTCYTLQTTMLQPEYDGKWIDGVRFLYNGEENKNFQHIEGLDQIKYR